MYLMPYDKNLVCPKETETVITNVGGEEVEAKVEKGMPPSVAHRIRWYLREHGISQRELAERMGTISQGQISHCLLGRYTLTRGRVDEICKALGITYEELMGDEVKVEDTAVEEAKEEVVEEAKEEVVEEVVKEVVEEVVKEEVCVSEEPVVEEVKQEVGEAVDVKIDIPYENVPNTRIPTKTPHIHQRAIDELVASARTIIENAESIIGSEPFLGDITVSIRLSPSSRTYINVDKDIYPKLW